MSASYNPRGTAQGVKGDAETGYAIVYSGLMDGLDISAAYFDDGSEAENETIGLKYTMGSVTAGYQITSVDYEAQASTDEDATHYGITVAVNENLTVGAGRQEIEFDGAADDEVSTGIGGSYTMGSISMKYGLNSMSSVGGSASAKDIDASIFSVSFAF